MNQIANSVELNEALTLYRPRVAAFINRTLYNHDDVDDLTQETLLKVSKGWDNFRGDSQLSSWIFQIASNVMTDYFRANASRPTSSGLSHENLHDAAPENPTKYIEQKQTSDCINEIMLTLSEPDRAILTDHDIEGLKLKELAVKEGATVNALKVRLHRARKRFKTILESACDFGKNEKDILLCEPKGSACNSKPK